MSTNPVTFLKEVRSEMEKVSWPTRQQATKLTLVVIGISLAVALFIGALDFGFTKVMEGIIR